MKKKIEAFVFIAAFAIAATFAFSTRAAAGAADCKDIHTDKGKVSGVLDEKGGVCGYKGIPYAAPPVGELRFALPREHAPWTDTLEAVKFGNECIQNPMSLTPSKKVVGNEDCLYLNVWSKADAAEKPKPVMVFIHGGGFIYGSADWTIYDGVNLAANGDVVIVTINYRLGAFGFLAHPALRDPAGFEGNYGMHDQIASLRWVKKNIAAFGGDPNNVTIFGESAGGISVGILLVTPAARGLFQKAIVESGPINLFIGEKAKTEADGEKIASMLGCGEGDAAAVAACLRKVSPETIMEKAPPGIKFLAEGSGNYMFSPVIDGFLIPDNPAALLAKGDFAKDVPIIIGSNTDEASFFTSSKDIKTPEDYKNNLTVDARHISDAFGIQIDPEGTVAMYPAGSYASPKQAYNAIVRDLAFTCPSRAVARTVAGYEPNNIYLYIFGKAPDERGILANWGAFHGSELAFVFRNFDFMGIKFASKNNSILSKKIMAYWSAFAHNGKPEVAGLPAWNAFDPKKGNYLYLDMDIKEGLNYQGRECDFLEKFLFGGK
jgi:para-nitrobenzyl esterase